MITDLVTKDGTLDEWRQRRGRVMERFLSTFGEEPTGLNTGADWIDEGEEQVHGLKAKRFRLELVPGFPVRGTVLIPDGEVPEGGYPFALCCQGTNFSLAHRSLMDPVGRPNRSYAFGLAKRGFLTVAVDQVGFGEGFGQDKCHAVQLQFAEAFPEWSLDGARNACHLRVLDHIIEKYPVHPDRIASIGNSLGGRGTLFATVTDPRISAAVVSTGISPEYTNVWRLLGEHRAALRAKERQQLVEDAGKNLYDYHELMALIAPRTVLFLEPFNDPRYW